MPTKILNHLFIISLFLIPFTLQAQATSTSLPQSSQIKDTTGGGLITFEAKLVDPSVKATKKTATVEVKVAGIGLVDPDQVGEKPQAGQAHLHYQLDGGPIIATTATKLSFHGLSSGTHRIVVTLAANDHQPMGRENVLTVTIP